MCINIVIEEIFISLKWTNKLQEIIFINFMCNNKFVVSLGYWVYGISIFVGYLTPNPFLCKCVLFKTIQFSISTQFNR